MRTRFSRGFAPLLVLGLLIACGPSDPLDQVVDADTFQDYHRWIYRHRSALDSRAARELSTAIEQLKLRIQLDQPGHPPARIAEIALAQIHDLTVREIITQSLVWRYRLLKQDNTSDDRLAELNAAAPITPDADQTIINRFRDQLEAIRRRQRERITEMSAIEARLLELNPQADFARVLGEPAPETSTTPAVRL